MDTITTSLKKLDLIALHFIKLYYNENFEVDFLEMVFWRMCPFSIKCLNYLLPIWLLLFAIAPPIHCSLARPSGHPAFPTQIMFTERCAAAAMRRVSCPAICPVRSTSAAREAFFPRRVPKCFPRGLRHASFEQRFAITEHVRAWNGRLPRFPAWSSLRGTQRFACTATSLYAASLRRRDFTREQTPFHALQTHAQSRSMTFPPTCAAGTVVACLALTPRDHLVRLACESMCLLISNRVPFFLPSVFLLFFTGIPHGSRGNWRMSAIV